MKNAKLPQMSTDSLVERFAANNLEQDRAETLGETSKVNALVDEMRHVQEELESRQGDQRRALLVLLTHPNEQVRLNAAKATVALNPIAARQALTKLAATRRYPQAAEAGMTIKALDEGSWKPT